MSVYVDNMRAEFGRMVMCHMAADTTDELLAMADKIGVRRKWLQSAGTPEEHFEIPMSKRAMAVKAGGIEVSKAGLVAVVKRKREAQAGRRCSMSNTQHPAGRLADQVADMTHEFNTPSYERGVLNGAAQMLRTIPALEAERGKLLEALVVGAELLRMTEAQRDQLRAEVARLRDANRTLASASILPDDKMIYDKAEIEALRAERGEAIQQQVSALDLVSRIRWALGDNGTRMQDELIEWCKVLRTAEAERDQLRAEVEARDRVAEQFDWLAERLEDVQIDGADPTEHATDTNGEDEPWPVLWRRAIDAKRGAA